LSVLSVVPETIRAAQRNYLREQAARCKLLAKGCAPGSASEALTALAAKYSKLATLRADRPIVLPHLQPKKEK
jgi:hypothetical protein